MEHSEQEEVIQDENLENGEDTNASDESLNSGEEDNTSDKGKNKSNWKEMKKQLKALKKENEELKRSQSDDLDLFEDEDEDEDDDEKSPSTRYSATELEIKFLKNKEAGEIEEDIKAVFKKYPQMKFDDAFALAKASKPATSETKKDFSFKSSAKPKKLEDMSESEAVDKLSPSDLLKWRRAKGENI